jgi:hypothetical protein
MAVVYATEFRFPGWATEIPIAFVVPTLAFLGLVQLVYRVVRRSGWHRIGLFAVLALAGACVPFALGLLLWAPDPVG